MEQKKDKDISHEGHRERLNNLIFNSGFENVSDVQIVEQFLTLIFPRGDVNPLAHRLLNKYGDFANIIDASVNDLVTVKGINDRSAKKIKSFRGFINYYHSCKLTKKTNLKNYGQFYDVLEKILRFETTEFLYIFAIDHNFNLIQKRCFDLKSVKEVGINPLQLYDFISASRPTYIIVAHNHPNGTAMPSANDHNACDFIEELIKNLECKLLDSFVVGNDGIYSEMQQGFVRSFDDKSMINFNE